MNLIFEIQNGGRKENKNPTNFHDNWYLEVFVIAHTEFVVILLKFVIVAEHIFWNSREKILLQFYQ